MNRGLSFFVASLQSLIFISVALGLVVAPLTIAWLFESDGSVEWIVVLRVAVFAYLLATGVDLDFSAGEIIGISYPDFVLNTMPLGLTLLMVISAARIGYRLSSASSLWPAWLGAGSSIAVASFTLSELASNSYVSVEQWQPLFIPAALFTLVIICFSVFPKRFELFDGANGPEAKERIAIRKFVFGLKEKLHWTIATALNPAATVAISVLAILLLITSLTIGITLAIGWVEVVRLYESMRVSVLGGVMLTIGQLAILPNLIIYAMAWVAGVGFSIGIGSMVSPLGTELGPLAAFPVFAAIPTGTVSQALVVILVPMLAAFIATFLVRNRFDQMRWEYATRLSAAFGFSLTTAVIAAFGAWLLATLASGSFGPGRLGSVGANPWWFAVAIFLEVLIPTFIAGLMTLKPLSDASQRRG